MSIFDGSSVGTVLAPGVATVLIFGAGIQLVPYGHAHTNPPVVQEPAWDSARAPAVYGGVRRLPHERDPVAVVQQRCTGVVAGGAACAGRARAFQCFRVERLE